MHHGHGRVPLPVDLRPRDSLLVTTGGDHLRPVKTCSFGDSHLPATSGEWPPKLKHVQFPNGQYVSYWIVFFLNLCIHELGQLSSHVTKTTPPKSSILQLDT